MTRKKTGLGVENPLSIFWLKFYGWFSNLSVLCQDKWKWIPDQVHWYKVGTRGRGRGKYWCSNLYLNNNNNNNHIIKLSTKPERGYIIKGS